MNRDLLKDYIEIVLDIYGKDVKKIILYGSYARGDNKIDSDIDIMILLDIQESQAADYQHELSAATFDYNLDNDLDINPIVQSEKIYNKWVGVYPFFKNVESEGVILYAA